MTRHFMFVASIMGATACGATSDASSVEVNGRSESAVIGSEVIATPPVLRLVRDTVPRVAFDFSYSASRYGFDEILTEIESQIESSDLVRRQPVSFDFRGRGDVDDAFVIRLLELQDLVTITDINVANTAVTSAGIARLREVYSLQRLELSIPRGGDVESTCVAIHDVELGGHLQSVVLNTMFADLNGHHGELVRIDKLSYLHVDQIPVASTRTTNWNEVAAWLNAYLPDTRIALSITRVGPTALERDGDIGLQLVGDLLTAVRGVHLIRHLDHLYIEAGWVPAPLAAALEALPSAPKILVAIGHSMSVIDADGVQWRIATDVDESLENLRSVARVIHLVVPYEPGRSDVLTDRGIAALSEMTSLKTLSLAGFVLSSDNLRALAQLPLDTLSVRMKEIAYPPPLPSTLRDFTLLTGSDSGMCNPFVVRAPWIGHSRWVPPCEGPLLSINMLAQWSDLARLRALWVRAGDIDKSAADRFLPNVVLFPL